MSGWLAVARDELRQLLRDHGVLLVLVGGTLFYGLFYPLPYSDQVARQVPVVVVDLDRGVASRQLTRMLGATEQIRVTAVLSERWVAERWLREGRAAGMVLIGEDFERRLLRGEVAELGILGNAAYLLLYSQVATGASQVAGTLSAGIVLNRLQAQGLAEAEALSLAEPIRLDLHELFNPGGGYGSYVVPAVLVLILQQTLLIGIAMRGAGGFESHQWAQVRPWEALLGRALVYTCLQLLLALVVLALVFKLYAFPTQASLLLSLVILLPFVVATVFFGLTLCSLFSSRETALQVLMLVSMPALFLAGFAWPAEAMPQALVWLGWLIPSTAGIDAFVRFHQMGASFAELRSTWGWLWGLGLAYALTAWIIMMRRAASPAEQKR